MLLSLFAGAFGGIGAFLLIHNFYPAEEIPVIFKENNGTVSAIDNVKNSVVSIRTYNNKLVQVSGGSGFVVDPSGIILTNRHVVEDLNAKYTVSFVDGRDFNAEVVSKDPLDDVAFLKISDGGVFDVAVLGDSDLVTVGQPVIAIGNALARFEHSVTMGIISALGRNVKAYNETAGFMQNISGLFQTDASINLGSSGGPLVDMDGRVIAMNAAVAEKGQNIGFAIPINDLKPIIESVKKNGEIVRPVLGVSFLMLTAEQAMEMTGTEYDHGALLIAEGKSAVKKGSVADKAGLKDGDLVLFVDEVAVDQENPLHSIVRSAFDRGEVKVVVWRDGQVKEVLVEF